MGIRVIIPGKQPIDVMPFARHKPVAWCWFNVALMQHNIQYGKRPLVKRGSGPLLLLGFSQGTFESIASMGGPALQGFARSMKRKRTLHLSPYPMTLDAHMLQCIAELVRDPETHSLLFLHARVLDLIRLQEENHARSLRKPFTYVKSDYDRERIVFARDYLLTHMDAPPSLQQLSAIAGINEFKLKNGFKEIFDQTVFGYLADVRLNMAARALREKQKTVTQIAFELGYASLQHFSAAFRKKFGMPPARYA